MAAATPTTGTAPPPVAEAVDTDANAFLPLLADGTGEATPPRYRLASPTLQGARFAADGTLLVVGAMMFWWRDRMLKSPMYRLLPEQTAGTPDKVPHMSPAAARFMASSVAVQTLTFWPVGWDLLVGYDAVWESPGCALGFAWPFVGASLDMAHSDRFEDLHESGRTVRDSLNADAAAIISVVFAVGALMIVVANKRMVQGRRLMMFALGLLVAAVIPEFSESRKTVDRIMNVLMQKAVFNAVIGAIVAAIGLDAQRDTVV